MESRPKLKPDELLLRLDTSIEGLQEQIGRKHPKMGVDDDSTFFRLEKLLMDSYLYLGEHNPFQPHAYTLAEEMNHAQRQRTWIDAPLLIVRLRQITFALRRQLGRGTHLRGAVMSLEQDLKSWDGLDPPRSDLTGPSVGMIYTLLGVVRTELQTDDNEVSDDPTVGAIDRTIRAEHIAGEVPLDIATLLLTLKDINMALIGMGTGAGDSGNESTIPHFTEEISCFIETGRGGYLRRPPLSWE